MVPVAGVGAAPYFPAVAEPGVARGAGGAPSGAGHRAEGGRPERGGGGGPESTFFAQLAGNGVFLAFIALSILLTLVLPLVIAVVSGDSLAGEAGAGTLRYLLTVPAGRTRLLAVKYTAVVIFGLAACLLVSAVSLIMGA